MPETVDWIDSAGNSLRLPVLRGVTGRFMPPVEVVDEPVPFGDGTRFRRKNVGPRPVVVPVDVAGTSRDVFMATVRTFARRFSPKLDEGKLVWTHADGVTRELRCHYVDGLGFAEELPDRATPSLLFRAPDPFWYATADYVETFQVENTARNFFPFLPFKLASSSLVAFDQTAYDADVPYDSPILYDGPAEGVAQPGGFLVDNLGDVDAWPVWVVTGPGSDLKLENRTSNKALTITGVTLAAGETITIDTRPGKKSVTRSNGTNLMEWLSNTSKLWPLVAANNRIQVTLAGSDTRSSVRLTARWRYLSA